MGSGTNAPLYTTSFSNSRPKSEDEREKHEGRLASALNIDRIQRVLDFDGYSTFPRCKSKTKIRRFHDISRTIWTGTEWSNDGRIPSKTCASNARIFVLIRNRTPEGREGSAECPFQVCSIPVTSLRILMSPLQSARCTWPPG